MTDNELVDLCMTCGCGLVISKPYYYMEPLGYFNPGVDADKALSGLRESIAARVLLPAQIFICSGFTAFTSRLLFTLKRDTGNSSWRISCSYPRIIVQEFYVDGFLAHGLMTTSLKSAYEQAKFDEQVNRMSMESLKDLVFSIVRDCSAKTKELRRTEILASSKEWI